MKTINWHITVSKIWIAFILIMALGLRFFQLGRSSFWLDEVMVANIVTTPDFLQLFPLVQSHVMSMPLDYITGWLASRVCTSEACLRFPSVIWGILGILLLYWCVRDILDEKTALAAALFMALSTIHIYYAQELRFYEAMVFFSILVIYLSWRALCRPSLNAWVWLVLAGVSGVYTHIYVALSLGFGFTWLILNGRRQPEMRKKWAGFLISSVLIGLLLLPGYLYYSEKVSYSEPFDAARAGFGVLMGLGWLPYSFPAQGIGWLLTGIPLILGVIGLAVVIRKREKVWLAWLLSGIGQAVLILFTDWRYQYWVNPRQLLLLLPLGCSVTALGLWSIWDGIMRRLPHAAPLPWQRGLMHCLAMCIIFCSIPGLQAVYQIRKSLSRETSVALATEWEKGDRILIIPQEYPLTYQYYLNKNHRPEIASALETVNDPDLSSLLNDHGRVFLITPSDYVQDHSASIQQAGFQAIPVTGSDSILPALWIKDLAKQ